MIAVIINTLAVVVGSALGLLLKKGIPERITDTLMKGVALCTLYIGWSGFFLWRLVRSLGRGWILTQG